MSLLQILSNIVVSLHDDRYYFCPLAMSKSTFLHSQLPIPVPPGYHEHQRPATRSVTAGGAGNTISRPGTRGGSREGGERRREIRASPSRPMSPREQFNQMSLQEEWMKRMNGTPSDKDEEVRREEEREYSDQKITCIYCKTTNFSVLLILAILANGIKTLILIPANIYNQSRGRTR